MAKKSKYKTVSIPRGVTDLIEKLIEEQGLWPSVSAFAREACLDKIEKEQKRPQEPREANPMAIRVGLRSTDILLTDAGKKWFLGTYTKGIIYEYDEYKPFSLVSMGDGILEATCPLGIPYRFPLYVDGEITFQMADQEEEPPVDENPVNGRRGDADV